MKFLDRLNFLRQARKIRNEFLASWKGGHLSPLENGHYVSIVNFSLHSETRIYSEVEFRSFHVVGESPDIFTGITKLSSNLMSEERTERAPKIEGLREFFGSGSFR